MPLTKLYTKREVSWQWHQNNLFFFRRTDLRLVRSKLYNLVNMEEIKTLHEKELEKDDWSLKMDRKAELS